MVFVRSDLTWDKVNTAVYMQEAFESHSKLSGLSAEDAAGMAKAPAFLKHLICPLDSTPNPELTMLLNAHGTLTFLGSKWLDPAATGNLVKVGSISAF